MEALCKLLPDLPHTVSQHFQVLINGFSPDSTRIKFEGNSSSIEAAHSRVTNILNELKHEHVKLNHDCTQEEFARYCKEMSKFQVFVSKNPESTSSLTIWSFTAANIEKFKPFLSITTVELNCSPEEVVYLRKFGEFLL